MESTTFTPDFLVLGAAKAGTSWVNLCLQDHPQVCIPTSRGEVDYFSYHYERGPEWYSGLFRHCRSALVCGEVSPSYLVHPNATQRIHAVCPKVKLVAILREPVARAYSHYCMFLRAGKVSEDVDVEMAPGTRFVDGGLYYKLLNPYLDTFPREQMHVLLYDDLQRDPRGLAASLYRAIGVDPGHVPAMAEKPFHVRKPRPRSQRFYNTVIALAKDFARRGAWAYGLLQWFRTKGPADLLHAINKGPDFPPMPEPTAKRLRDYYRADTERLEELVGRDLTSWKQGIARPAPVPSHPAG